MQAMRVFEKLAPHVVTAYPAESWRLVQALEGLPLSLQVAGRLLNVEAQYGWGISELMAELTDGLALLDQEAPPDMVQLAMQTTPTVAVLLQRSTNRLDADARWCFARLGAFAPKPATFDRAALEVVWRRSDVKPTLRTLISRGLLEPVEQDRFQLHSLLALHARALLEYIDEPS
jgi:hypothetical protein